jgi:hypothetical protein
MKTTIIIPKKIKVGFNPRTDTYTIYARKISKQIFDIMGWEYKELNKWADIPYDEIIQYIKDKNYKSLSDINKNNGRFRNIIIKRKLSEQICTTLGWKYRGRDKWHKATTDEIIQYFKDNNYKSLSDIKDKNHILYNVILKRKISKQLRIILGWKYKRQTKII